MSTPVVDIPSRRRLVASAALLASCPLLMLAFSHLGASLFPAYRILSKALMGLLSRIAGIAPFALWDLGLMGLALGFATRLAIRIRRHLPLVPWASRLCLLMSVALALFVDGWALNHYAPPLAQDLGLDVGVYHVDELADATSHYLEQAAALAPRVPRSSDGSLAPQDFLELARVAGASYARPGDSYEVLRGSDAPVKALLAWGVPLLYSGHVGMFWAPTGEAGVPLDCAPADLPFTMCHEAAHRLGIASEEEANFAAYLACEASDDPRLAYSGSYNAFAYCLNALSKDDPDRASEVVQDALASADQDGVRLVLGDYEATREHYARYRGSFQKVGRSVNDGYLRSFGQSEGVRSYGLVVDYLIAWHLR